MPYRQYCRRFGPNVNSSAGYGLESRMRRRASIPETLCCT